MKILIYLLILRNILTQYSHAEAVEKNSTDSLDDDLLSVDYTLENIILLSHRSLDKKLSSELSEIRESCRSCVGAIHEKIAPNKFEVAAAPQKEIIGGYFWNYRTISTNCYEALKRNNISTKFISPHTNEYIFSLVKPKKITEPFAVSCDLSTDGGGWTVIQRREDGSENFERNWFDYANGFGSFNGEFFIGLEKLHALTNTGWPQELYIILEDFDGQRKYARYDRFSIGNSNTSYALFVEGFTGDTGDNFSDLKGQKFTTFDVDNDKSKDNCAVLFKGGWWYNSCHGSNLNGLYLMGTYPKSKFAQGVVWHSFHGHYYSLKFVQMMIRPNMRIKLK